MRLTASYRTLFAAYILLVGCLGVNASPVVVTRRSSPSAGSPTLTSAFSGYDVLERRGAKTRIAFFIEPKSDASAHSKPLSSSSTLSKWRYALVLGGKHVFTWEDDRVTQGKLARNKLHGLTDLNLEFKTLDPQTLVWDTAKTGCDWLVKSVDNVLKASRENAREGLSQEQEKKVRELIEAKESALGIERSCGDMITQPRTAIHSPPVLSESPTSYHFDPELLSNQLQAGIHRSGNA